jgi:ABC-2 type transport system ATP-binding protein
LTKYYNDFCAVDQVSLTIQKGEILGLLGPNGAGKTTILRMLTGFLIPTSGNIRIKDYTIYKNLLEIKQLIGYLPESAPLYHNMLVYDYLEYVANTRGVGKDQRFARLRYLSDICGLNSVMHKAIGELSKGLRQRVGLAHAMMSDPEILVLDEPTSGLDPNQIIEIRKIIRQIRKEKTIIISTHILSEAEAMCDRIVIINKGRIVADDSTESLKQSASGERVVDVSLLNADFQSIKKELRDYFISPIAYIVISIFLLIIGWLFFTTFFFYNHADLRNFFTLLPIIFSFVIPAIAMRLLSEELSVGSYEILITMPVTSQDVIAGKFLASVIFVVAMLIPTFAYPITISFLGHLDWVRPQVVISDQFC